MHNMIFVTYSKTNHNLLNTKQNKIKPEVGIYAIACDACHEEIIEETSSKLYKRLYEHNIDRFSKQHT